MTTAAALDDVQVHRANVPPRKRHLGLLAFATLSLLVAMISVSQEENPEVGSMAYWLLILPAAILPMFDAPRIFTALIGRAWVLLLFLFTAGVWHLMTGDTRAVLQLGLLVLGLTWISIPGAKYNIGDLCWLYVALVIFGAFLWIAGLNLWGLLPGTTSDQYSGAWRVSFFPNIANSGMLSLAMLLILTKDRRTFRSHLLIFALVIYFLLFSFVRTALIGTVLYVGLRWWFARRSTTPRGMFWTTIAVAVGINVLMAVSAVAVVYLQDNPIFSRLLLQGASDLDQQQVLEQMYRPLLWLDQLNLFVTSPGLMGWGSFESPHIAAAEMLPDLEGAGTAALSTRLLATYGLPGALFTIYLVSRLWQLAKADDRWACACFAPVFLVNMNWGSVLHPTDALFALFLLTNVRGSRGFS
jgi:hypothetical protein